MYYKEIKKAKPISEEDVKKLQETVAKILENVRLGGDQALKEYYTRKYNFKPDSFLVPPEEAARAREKLPAEVIEELDFGIQQVTAFAKAQRASLTEFEKETLPGVRMGQKITPVDSCGCYIPAGRYPCLTAAVMSVAPAKVAGVKRIICCSPRGPDGSINAGLLYTMHQLGVDEIYAIAGANAIGVMAYGTETIKPVDIIVGPGNAFVTEAKRQAFGTVGIDFLAGPSECLVIADETARADFIAADLLAQCEHDPNARGSLVTTSERLAYEVLDEIEGQLKERTTEETARTSWENNGEVILVKNNEDAAKYTNEYAPEHLEVHSQNPREFLPLLKHYGSLFLGENTAEVYADKVAGTNHILPTGRAARYTGGLWVGNYLKVTTYQEVDVKASLMLAKYAETQAKFEGMDCHRYAATIRLQNLKAN